VAGVHESVRLSQYLYGQFLIRPLTADSQYRIPSPFGLEQFRRASLGYGCLQVSPVIPYPCAYLRLQSPALRQRARESPIVWARSARGVCPGANVEKNLARKRSRQDAPAS
jgi:hypothetical protein